MADDDPERHFVPAEKLSHAETDGVTSGHEDSDDSCEGSGLAGAIEQQRQADTELNSTGDG